MGTGKSLLSGPGDLSLMPNRIGKLPDAFTLCRYLQELTPSQKALCAHGLGQDVYRQATCKEGGSLCVCCVTLR